MLRMECMGANTFCMRGRAESCQCQAAAAIMLAAGGAVICQPGNDCSVNPLTAAAATDAARSSSSALVAANAATALAYKQHNTLSAPHTARLEVQICALQDTQLQALHQSIEDSLKHFDCIWTNCGRLK